MKKSINFKAKRLIVSVLSAVMCLTTVSQNAFAADEFADLASDYGCSVSIGDEGIAEPQMHKDVSFTFTSEDIWRVGQDSTVLAERVQLQRIEFSENIDYIIFYVGIRTSPRKEWCTIKRGDTETLPFDVPFGSNYRIYMKPVSKDRNNPISETNKGTVNFYWTDRSWEVTE